MKSIIRKCLCTFLSLICMISLVCCAKNELSDTQDIDSIAHDTPKLSFSESYDPNLATYDGNYDTIEDDTGNKYVWITNNQSYVEFWVEVPYDGYYTASIGAFGLGQETYNYVLVDSEPLTALLYATNNQWQANSFESIPLSAGAHTIRLSCYYGWTAIDTLTVTYEGEYCPITIDRVVSGIDTTIDGDLTTVCPTKTDKLLLNPGKGLVTYDMLTTDNSGGYYDAFGVGYTRFHWADIEPEQGVYNWDIIDSWMASYTNIGKKVAFGVMNLNTSVATQYITPQWVFDAGAEGKSFEATSYDGTTFTQVCPNWSDPVFIGYLTDFVKALGERYNGNPNIAFIDIRSYGNWGEQHLTGVADKTYPYIEPEALVRDYMQPYLDAFGDTLLVNCAVTDTYMDAYDWAIEHGISLRLDGLLYYTYASELALVDGVAPSIGEFPFSLSKLENEGYWTRENIEKCIRDGKISYLHVTPEMYQKYTDDFVYFANLCGYHFYIESATYSTSAGKGDKLNGRINIANDGVTRCYEDGMVKIALLDISGEVVTTFDNDADIHYWMPDSTSTIDFSLDTSEVEAGEYYIAMGIFEHTGDQSPTYKLASDCEYNGWYVLGRTSVK